MSLTLTKSHSKRAFEVIVIACFFAFFFGPILTIAVWAVTGKWNYPALLPQQFSLHWWKWVFSQTDLVGPMRLSFEFAIIVTILSTAICLPAAYAFARFQFPFKRFIYMLYLLPNAFPIVGLYVSIAVMFYRLNLMGTFFGVILIQLVNTLMFMTWIPAAAFQNVSRNYEDACRDVGAGPFRTFLRVTLPLAAPGIIVAVIFSFLAALDEAQGTLIVGMPTYITMPVKMYSLVTDYPGPVGAVFSVLLTTPSVVLLLLARRFLGSEALSKAF
ncbi:ABC transporter permease [Alicyclobacillus dauci]|uniref:ABC transporter permease n=1 Tax=Alicyclobacillus dauci TaxID=1475485 RepID=A0ABY6Z0E4_9BACL|nr:ABC transporter permease [Alicyclobacillus dauci]WAH36317.1 ABC transporter permease [Alicyclobacillus dauci]